MKTRQMLKGALVVATLGGVVFCVEGAAYAAPPAPDPLQIDGYLQPHENYEARALAARGGFDLWFGDETPAPVPAGGPVAIAFQVFDETTDRIVPDSAKKALKVCAWNGFTGLSRRVLKMPQRGAAVMRVGTDWYDTNGDGRSDLVMAEEMDGDEDGTVDQRGRATSTDDSFLCDIVEQKFVLPAHRWLTSHNL